MHTYYNCTERGLWSLRLRSYLLTKYSTLLPHLTYQLSLGLGPTVRLSQINISYHHDVKTVRHPLLAHTGS